MESRRLDFHLHRNSFDEFCVHSSIFQTCVVWVCVCVCEYSTPAPSLVPFVVVAKLHKHKRVFNPFPNVRLSCPFMMQFIVMVQSWHKANMCMKQFCMLGRIYVSTKLNQQGRILHPVKIVPVRNKYTLQLTLSSKPPSILKREALVGLSDVHFGGKQKPYQLITIYNDGEKP